jgi:hypothetical protein
MVQQHLSELLHRFCPAKAECCGLFVEPTHELVMTVLLQLDTQPLHGTQAVHNLQRVPD